MKDARRILELVRSVCPQGVFPGRNGEEEAAWQPDPFHVLISTVLSQRTKDANTFAASSRLFAEFDSPEELANAPQERIEDLIRPAGFPKAKGKAIREIARIIHERGDVVPDDLESLVALPMVGRKTANCVLSYGFGKEAICVDTHVHRIANRIGLCATKDPEETEYALRKVVPRELWIDVNSLLVRFGQTICLPRNPKCPRCPVAPFCDYYGSVSKAKEPPLKAHNGRRMQTDSRGRAKTGRQ
jgi:endonuclease III